MYPNVAEALSYLHMMQPDPTIHHDIIFCACGGLQETTIPLKVCRGKIKDMGTGAQTLHYILKFEGSVSKSKVSCQHKMGTIDDQRGLLPMTSELQVMS